MNDLFREEAVHHATRRLAGEVVLATPLSIKLLGGLLVVIIAGGTVFATTASYTRKETVSGWIVPEGGLIRIAARQGGIVEALHVHEGSDVQAATPLVTMKLSSDLNAGDAGKALAEDLAAEAAANEAQARAAQAKFQGQQAELTARRGALLRELDEAHRRVDVAEHRRQLADGDVARAETLLARGFLAKSSVDALRSTALSVAQDASTARAAALDLERQIGDLGHELTAAPAELAMIRAQAAQTRATLSQRRVASETQSTSVATASIAGRVVAIPVERGQSVSAGAAVAVLMPRGSDLGVELYVPSRAAGFIKVGQEVRLLYHAFPYQTFGAGQGIVKSISRTVLAPSEVAIPGLTVQEPVFRVRVALKRQTVAAYGEIVPLQPGMLLSADVVLDRRSLFEWLLDPLYAVGRRA